MVQTATLTSFEVPNETGALATVGAAMAVEELEVHGFTLCAKESMKTVHVVTEERAPPLAMLDHAAVSRRSCEVLVVRLADGARELGEVGRRLADAGVNVEATMSLTETPRLAIALAVDQPRRARKVLAADAQTEPMPT